LENYWNQKYEVMEREELEALQLERLQKTVERCYHDVPHYRKKFQEAGIDPSDIQSLSDITKLPFTVKTDLRDNYPYGMFAVPMSDIVRIHSSSGTTGKPTVVGYNRHDLNVWSELMARSLVCAGAEKNDVIHNAYGYGLFTGGLGVHYGSEKLGASVIPISGGNSEKQVMIMQDYGSTVLCCTPSYALNLAEVMKEMNVAPTDLKLKVGIFGAEPWSDEMRNQIEKVLGIKALDIYGLSEIIGPGVGMECPYKKGLHIWEDHFLIEIVDPDTLEPMPEGEKGELVITSLTKEALPMIRYRTRDITTAHYEKCECGRTHVRIERVSGRSDDMLIIRGVNVFPSQIESALLNIGQVEPHYLIIVSREGNLDALEIQVEVNQELFTDDVKGLETLEKKIKHAIESTLGISVKVRLVEPKSLERSMGKAKRVLDLRKK